MLLRCDATKAARGWLTEKHRRVSLAEGQLPRYVVAIAGRLFGEGRPRLKHSWSPQTTHRHNGPARPTADRLLKKLEIFKHHDRFLVWPMTMAIQTCSRMLDMRGNADVDPCIENLRVLAHAMKELVNPKHVRPGLPEKIDDAWMVAVEGGANAE